MHGRGHAWQGVCVARDVHGWGACVTGGICGRGVHGRGTCIAGGVCVAGKMATAADGAHPGMHCMKLNEVEPGGRGRGGGCVSIAHHWIHQ